MPDDYHRDTGGRGAGSSSAYWMVPPLPPKRREVNMIWVEKVTKVYGNITALDGISLEIPEGSTVVILGPSGSGKTTLLRLIAGLEIPDDGTICIKGTPVSRPGWALAPHKRGLGFVFQAPALWPHMTVAQNIMFGLHGIPGENVRKRLQYLLERTSLSGLERRYPHQISGGEARRVALARSLAPQPRCLLMDEPLTNLDSDLKEKMLSLIKEEVSQTGISLVYVTHDREEARQIAEHMFILKDGCLTGQEQADPY
ncbi:ABC transporter ATP-binding protein [Chloroflexota bacterium]